MEQQQKTDTQSNTPKTVSGPERLQQVGEAADAILAAVKRAVENEDQFFLYHVSTGAGSTKDTQERVLEKLDTKAVKDVTAVLKDLHGLLREIHGVPEKPEEKALRVVLEAGEDDWNG